MDEKLKNKKINNLKKSMLTAYILWFWFGWLGLHRFYVGSNALGFIYAISLGLFGLGWLIDLILIPDLVIKHNDKIDLDYRR